MTNRNLITFFRAAIVGVLVVLLRAHLLAGMDPNSWTPVPASGKWVLFLCTFALAYPLSLRPKGWLLTLLVIGSYSFAQLASTAPPGSDLARWLWIGFFVTVVPTMVLSALWLVQLSRKNRLQQETFGELDERS